MELLQLAIIGTIVSLIIQGIKKFAGTSEYITLALTVGVSLLGGAAYFYAKDTAFWPTFVQILSFAGAAYSYLVSRFPKASNS